MSMQWVVLALNSKSHGEDPEVLQRSLSKALRGTEVYIPAVVTQVGDDRMVHYLVDGYAFAQRTRPDCDYLRLPNANRYVAAVLTQGTGRCRCLATVSNREIDEFKRQARVEVDQGISVDDTVLILSGPYRNIQATVVEEIPEKKSVQVFVQLRSKQSLLTLPRSFLQLVKKARPTDFLNRVRRLRKWTQKAQVVAGQSVQVMPVRDSFQEYSWVLSYYRQLQPMKLVQDVESLDMSEAAAYLQRWHQMAQWLDQSEILNKPIPNLDLVPLRNAFQKWSWINGVYQQYQGFEGDDMISNIIVDGHNLAFRALYAPGMQDLKDSKGRPTGVIYAFLRSLGALRKRYHDAMFFVCWDGSSQRRKALNPEYKANRKAHGVPLFDQISYLRDKLLPYLGIAQAWHPEEEADDVIGTLVRGPLQGDRNVIISTDRDFLQLVTRTDVLLVPAVGGRKEILFDPDRVEFDYQVPPEKMVCLRALAGDKSDNLPGVERVPKKILASLVRSHDTVDGIFASGLAGVTKSQYQRLREAETRVKLNAGLMSIRTDISFETVDPSEDEAAVTQHLQDVDVNPEDFLETFFRPSAGFLKSGNRAK